MTEDQGRRASAGPRATAGLVAPVPPLDVTGTRTVTVGVVVWAIAFVALLPFYGHAARRRQLWWLWTCVAGFGLGLLGREYCRRREHRLRELPASRSRARWAPPVSEPRRAAGRAQRMISRSASPQVSNVSVSWNGAPAAGWCWDGSSRTSECAPQPWSKDTAWPSLGDETLAQTPNWQVSGPGDPEQEPARAAVRRAPPWRSGRRDRADRRTTARAASSRPSTDSTSSRPSPTSRITSRWSRARRRRRVPVADQVARHQPRVVAGDRHQVAGAQVLRRHPVLPRQPLRGHARRLARKHHHLVDGHGLLPGRPGDRDRPAPADVARLGRRRRSA